MHATIEQIRAAVPWLIWDEQPKLCAGFRGIDPASIEHPLEEPLWVRVGRDCLNLALIGLGGDDYDRYIYGYTLEERLAALPGMVREMSNEIVEEAEQMKAAAMAIGGAP